MSALLAHKSTTKYRLIKTSGVHKTIVSGICCNKVKIGNCFNETICELAKTLDVPLEIVSMKPSANW